jgi:hypothetical protein
MKLKLCSKELEVGGKYLGTELRDSNDILHDAAAMRTRLAEDGYLLIRGLHPRQRVLDARQAIVQYMAQSGCLLPGSDPMEARINPGAKVPPMMGHREITSAPAVRAVLEGEPVFSLFQRLLGKEVLTYSYKWLRAVPKGEFTGAHYDVVYMGRGTLDKLMTIWTPFDDVTFDKGTLAICCGSHNLPGYAKLRETYGKMDVDRDRVSGWFSDDPEEIVNKFGGKWQTTEFRAGDVILFGMFTLHASIANTSDTFRISCDTRFQAADEPVDERWIGENPKGHYAWHSEPAKMVSMEAAKAQWGL